MSTVAENLAEVRRHVAQIASGCGRNPSEIRVVAVTKGCPLELLLQAYDADIRDFGESRVQEALLKIEEAPDDIRWHLIGPLQRKKVKNIIRRFALVHSVDSVPLAEEIAYRSEAAGEVTGVLLEVNVSGEGTKHGYRVEEWRRRFREVMVLPGIEIEGLMTIAPLTDDEGVIRACFSGLRRLRDELMEEHGGSVDLHHLSMGMTHDYPIAIEEGATLLRVGKAIFGSVEE